MTDSAASPKRHPRFALRFSLRMLLAAFTAFAIGFPVWYRWPYEEEEKHNVKMQGYRQVTTWQRKWGGGRWMHGPKYRSLNGNVIILETHRRGVLHGPWKSRGRDHFSNDIVHTVGQFSEGKKEGTWRKLDAQGNVIETSTWRADLLDGPLEISRSDATRVQFDFEAGHVKSVDCRPAEDRLSDRWSNIGSIRRRSPESSPRLHILSL